MNATNVILCVVDTSWELEHAHRIGKEVQRLRKLANLTAQQLGDRTDELGLKMTRQAISDLENGRRRYVTTAELIILSAALNTSPVTLLFPGPYDRQTNLLPKQEVIEFDAAQWFSGLGYYRTIGLLEEGEENFEAERAAGREWVASVSALSSARSLADAERDRMIRALEAAVGELTTERAASKRLAELEKQNEIVTKRLDEIDKLTGGSADA